jgi:hypothetical protein
MRASCAAREEMKRSEDASAVGFGGAEDRAEAGRRMLQLPEPRQSTNDVDDVLREC